MEMKIGFVKVKEGSADYNSLICAEETCLPTDIYEIIVRLVKLGWSC